MLPCLAQLEKVVCLFVCFHLFTLRLCARACHATGGVEVRGRLVGSVLPFHPGLIAGMEFWLSGWQQLPLSAKPLCHPKGVLLCCFLFLSWKKQTNKEGNLGQQNLAGPGSKLLESNAE